MKRLLLIFLCALMLISMISCASPTNTPGTTEETQLPPEEISSEEKQRLALYVAVMRAAFHVENGGNGFVAVRLDTLEGLSDSAKQMVLIELEDLSELVLNFEDVKNDKTKFKLDGEGRLQSTIDGSLLSINLDEYSSSKAKITGISWFGNLGAVLPTYEATYENGVWKLKLIGMAIS